MWERLDEPDDGWQPVRTRRAQSIRVVALVVVAAMVLALVIPAILRLMRSGNDRPRADDTVVALVIPVSLAESAIATSWP